MNSMKLFEQPARIIAVSPLCRIDNTFFLFADTIVFQINTKSHDIVRKTQILEDSSTLRQCIISDENLFLIFNEFYEIRPLTNLGKRQQVSLPTPLPLAIESREQIFGLQGDSLFYKEGTAFQQIDPSLKCDQVVPHPSTVGDRIIIDRNQPQLVEHVKLHDQSPIYFLDTPAFVPEKQGARIFCCPFPPHFLACIQVHNGTLSISKIDLNDKSVSQIRNQTLNSPIHNFVGVIDRDRIIHVFSQHGDLLSIPTDTGSNTPQRFSPSMTSQMSNSGFNNNNSNNNNQPMNQNFSFERNNSQNFTSQYPNISSSSYVSDPKNLPLDSEPMQSGSRGFYSSEDKWINKTSETGITEDQSSNSVTENEMNILDMSSNQEFGSQTQPSNITHKEEKDKTETNDSSYSHLVEMIQKLSKQIENMREEMSQNKEIKEQIQQLEKSNHEKQQQLQEYKENYPAIGKLKEENQHLRQQLYEIQMDKVTQGTQRMSISNQQQHPPPPPQGHPHSQPPPPSNRGPSPHSHHPSPHPQQSPYPQQPSHPRHDPRGSPMSSGSPTHPSYHHQGPPPPQHHHPHPHPHPHPHLQQDNPHRSPQGPSPNTSRTPSPHNRVNSPMHSHQQHSPHPQQQHPHQQFPSHPQQQQPQQYPQQRPPQHSPQHHPHSQGQPLPQNPPPGMPPQGDPHRNPPSHHQERPMYPSHPQQQPPQHPMHNSNQPPPGGYPHQPSHPPPQGRGWH